MPWTPGIGTAALVAKVGQRPALDALVALLTGEVSGPDFVSSPTAAVLLDIGDGHAERLMVDPTGARMAYWPRVWAARSMAYLGDVGGVPALVEAIDDDHWRVRMTSIQTLGRLGAQGVTSRLIAGLEDEHQRVQAAAVVALGRIGDADALGPLSRHLTAAKNIHKTATAITKITQRIMP